MVAHRADADAMRDIGRIPMVATAATFIKHMD
jgi:hypothetical protein